MSEPSNRIEPQNLASTQVPTPDSPAPIAQDIQFQFEAPVAPLRPEGSTKAEEVPASSDRVQQDRRVENSEVSDQNTSGFVSFLGGLIAHPFTPFAFLLVSLVVLFGIANHHWRFLSVLPAPKVVIFDPVKFMNAQRAAASIIAARPDSDMSFTLTQVAKQAESVILEEAQGAVIIIKQAVVVPRDLEDITDRVLTRFGLPTDVPTVTVRAFDENSSAFVAPTDYSFSEKERKDDYKDELSERRRRLLQDMNNQSAQEKVVP